MKLDWSLVNADLNIPTAEEIRKIKFDECLNKIHRFFAIIVIGCSREREGKEKRGGRKYGRATIEENYSSKRWSRNSDLSGTSAWHICTNESQLPAIDKFPMGHFVASAFTTISRDEVWKHLVRDTDRNLTKQTRTLRCT